MSSAGSQIVNFRLVDADLVRVHKQIARRNLHSTGQPWNLSDFIRAAIAEKLAHMERSRRPRTRPSGKTTKGYVYEG